MTLMLKVGMGSGEEEKKTRAEKQMEVQGWEQRPPSSTAWGP